METKKTYLHQGADPIRPTYPVPAPRRPHRHRPTAVATASVKAASVAPPKNVWRRTNGALRTLFARGTLRPIRAILQFRPLRPTLPSQTMKASLMMRMILAKYLISNCTELNSVITLFLSILGSLPCLSEVRLFCKFSSPSITTN